MDSTLKETTAWKVIDQILEHTWGVDDIDSDIVISACRMFEKAGGSWKKAIQGDVTHLSILEDCIGNVIGSPKITNVAMKVALRDET